MLARLCAGLGGAAFCLATLVGCAPRDAPGLCRGQGECDKNRACIVGRCRPRAEPVVPLASRRIVLEPTKVAVLSSRENERVDPSTIGFGRASAGDVVMLLAFDDALGSDVELDSAFLVLEPAEGAPSPFSPVPIEIASIRDEWSRESVSWGRQPSLGLPETVADATPRSHNSLRIDVTHFFGSAQTGHGIAILAKGKDPIGAFYATGLGTGTAPRLELYLKVDASLPSASASASASASLAPSGSASSDAPPSDGGGKRRPRDDGKSPKSGTKQLLKKLSPKR